MGVAVVSVLVADSARFLPLRDHFFGMEVVHIALGQQAFLRVEHLYGAAQAGVEAADGANYVDTIEFTGDGFGYGRTDDSCFVRSRAAFRIAGRNVPCGGGDDLVAIDLAVAHDYPVSHSTAHTFYNTDADSILRPFVLVPDIGIALLEQVQGNSDNSVGHCG